MTHTLHPHSHTLLAPLSSSPLPAQALVHPFPLIDRLIDRLTLVNFRGSATSINFGVKERRLTTPPPSPPPTTAFLVLRHFTLFFLVATRNHQHNGDQAQQPDSEEPYVLPSLCIPSRISYLPSLQALGNRNGKRKGKLWRKGKLRREDEEDKRNSKTQHQGMEMEGGREMEKEGKEKNWKEEN